jgi:PIN domain nuclease of toxin-antitoxin system
LKGYLLDTNIALLAVSTPERLSSQVRAAIEQGPAFLSVIAYWEVTLQIRKGILDVGDPRQWWRETLDSLVLTPLSYRPEHVAAALQLPPIHQDPFDRALLAQAAAEDLTLLTIDRTLDEYASETLRVLG